MKVKSIHIKDFKRFKDLAITDLPENAKLVVLIGPNGCGKSSLFEAIYVGMSRSFKGFDRNLLSYYFRDSGMNDQYPYEKINISFHEGTQNNRVLKKGIYVRSAHRNDPSFSYNQLTKKGSVLDEGRIGRLIDNNPTVADNYMRLVAHGLEWAFETLPGSDTLEKFRDAVLEEIRIPIKKLFPDLTLNSLGNPLNQNATFRFEKGEVCGFSYENLSGGEKAAFDLVLDLVVKRKEFDDTVFCIDEPEAHISMRIQSRLLSVLYGLVPRNCQLWIATHSIGMMREAYTLQKKHGDDIVFLDFDNMDFDQPQKIAPAKMNRALWERMHEVVLGDLANLVAPDEIYVCESGTEKSLDANCYNRIFSETYPHVKFISVGSKSDVVRVSHLFLSAMPNIKIYPLRDKDNMTPEKISEERTQGTRILSRQCIEKYLLDEEVVEACFHKHALGLRDKLGDKLEHAKKICGEAEHPKKAASDLRTFIVNEFSGVPIGDNVDEFLEHMAQLIKPGMEVYKELEKDIFSNPSK